MPRIYPFVLTLVYRSGSMFEVFQKYLLNQATLTDEELEMIRVRSVPKKLRRHQYLLQEGDINRHNSFIVRGCLRLYRLGEDGTEHILRFGIENWWMSDRESYTTGQPSKGFIDALEDSELLTWTKESWEELMAAIPELAALIERILERSFNASQNRIHAVISLSAEERYQQFLKSFPDIFNRVPLHMIASYLGVNRKTLSRIRHQFNHK